MVFDLGVGAKPLLRSGIIPTLSNGHVDVMAIKMVRRPQKGPGKRPRSRLEQTPPPYLGSDQAPRSSLTGPPTPLPANTRISLGPYASRHMDSIPQYPNSPYPSFPIPDITAHTRIYITNRIPAHKTL